MENITRFESESGDIITQVGKSDVRRPILVQHTKLELVDIESGETVGLVEDEVMQELDAHKGVLDRLQAHLADPRASASWNSDLGPTEAIFETHKVNELIARASQLDHDEAILDGEVYKIYATDGESVTTAYRVDTWDGRGCVTIGQIRPILKYSWEWDDLLHVPMTRDVWQVGRLEYYKQIGSHVLSRDTMELDDLESIILRWMGIRVNKGDVPEPFKSTPDYVLPTWIEKLLTPVDGRLITRLRDYNEYIRGLMQNALKRLAYDPDCRRNYKEGVEPFTRPADWYGIYWDDYVAIVRASAAASGMTEAQAWALLHKPADVQLIKWLGGVQVEELEASENLSRMLSSFGLGSTSYGGDMTRRYLEVMRYVGLHYDDVPTTPNSTLIVCGHDTVRDMLGMLNGAAAGPNYNVARQALLDATAYLGLDVEDDGTTITVSMARHSKRTSRGSRRR